MTIAANAARQARPAIDVDTNRLSLVADSLSVLSCLLMEAANGRAKNQGNLALVDADEFASMVSLFAREMRDAGGGEI